jgi:hemerythrin-like domain-containing protein
LCYKVLSGEEVQYEEFYKIIDFVRNYADKHHHGKEETMLFNRMMEELGPTAEKLVRHGMLVEHDLGRLHMQELEMAVKQVLDGNDEARLDIIANAISYTHLLHRHIQKEDDVVYKFAQNKLDKETLERLNHECENYERDEKAKAVREKYLAMVEEFEAKI